MIVLGKRQMSTRSRLPFPLPNPDDHHPKDSNPDVCLQLLTKDISQNSLSSVTSNNAQTPLTDTTDDGLTPITPTNPQTFPPNDCCINNYYTEQATNSPIRHHRTFSSESLDEQFLAPDAQYEVIQSQSTLTYNQRPQNSPSNQSNLTTTISVLNNYQQNHPPSNFNNNLNSYLQQNKSIKGKLSSGGGGSNPGSPNRKSISSNISTLIQNLGGNPVGLLYGDVNSVEDEDEVVGIGGGGSHSDAMDSGWQSSSSDRQDPGRLIESNEDGPRSVNV